MSVLPNYDSPLALKTFLQEHGMAMQKKFGQNFMINPSIRRRLVDSLDLNECSTVWEIGPGLGAITSDLFSRTENVLVFEIDRGFVAALKEFFRNRNSFTVVEGDVLKNWKQAVSAYGLPDRLIGNLPYNIAATIIADMISEGERIDTMVITVQKEVAQRMTAKPDTEHYSSFSVLCQWAYSVETITDIAAGAFWPRPNVTSRAVKMKKKTEWPCCSDTALFQSILRGLFSSRRKTIKNNFTAWLASSTYYGNREDSENIVRNMLSGLAIDPGRRAETLTVLDFCRISDKLIELYGYSGKS
ncbi:16S rRNA (adenine(1518)-N(6)/adenine(1519)-N(6))-dimethyltransferase RsmA [Brucepastera parasyntrophica]|uniref:16S rRNA (adenine(1518)-N(6)/adenine(1519)-N(6))- dimethyltransferase RsmA n=1 Tax=Brucepastera parasyntrophica TaxID=2880008 RepID=UPI00210D610C|nr:16S rRNA (adenine(1518)-N(6)/adenine(1519)-N(6))-dimethyltransferase RsmA [Brucepastera parasyntrophica]ULQ60064.1 16S rRNA (adenine(1518)-N(6)/adenine(1519)-N(6))-dimethyltransferase RsmA [Brucepastera parasyntrophica]